MQNLLKKLISIKSISGEENKIQKFIYRYIKLLGYIPEWVKGNVVVKISGKNTDNALVFNSHIDTVNPGDEYLWKHNPYKGDIDIGRIYGLGASDEKAVAAVLMEMAKYYSKVKPECDIFLTFVVNEEVDGKGTKDVMNWFNAKHKRSYKNVAGILGEPTNLNNIEIGHRGNIFIEIITNGKSGHGSSPVKFQEHAIFKMYKIIDHLDNWSLKSLKIYKDKLLGYPTIGLATSIIAGNPDNPNKFPDTCIMTCDIRTTPKFHSKALQLIKKELGKIDKNAMTNYLAEPVFFGITNAHEHIVDVLQKASGAKISVSSTSNDMCFFTKLGIPAVVFGPGDPDWIHKPDEFCEVVNLVKCLKVYKKVIIEFAKID
jgi:acetylornithine deacetylase